MVPQRNSTDMELQKYERKLKVLNNIDQLHAIKCSTTHVHSCSWLNRLASHLTKIAHGLMSQSTDLTSLDFQLSEIYVLQKFVKS